MQPQPIKAMQKASLAFLSTQLPTSWYRLSPAEQAAYISKHAHKAAKPFATDVIIHLITKYARRLNEGVSRKYYLMGSAMVDLYKQSGIAPLLQNYGRSLVVDCFDDNTLPLKVMESVAGYADFIEITPNEYNAIIEVKEDIESAA